MLQTVRTRRFFLFGVAIIFAAAFLFFISSPSAFAQALDAVGEQAGLSSTPIAVIIGRVIAVFLSILGVIFLGLVMYSGFLWMTAGGSSEKVEQAKKTLVQGVVGMIIVLASYGITTFVVQALTGQGIFGNGTGTNSGSVSIEPFSGSYGSIIRDHYPERYQTNVPRNTKIFVTFRDQMSIGSFIASYDDGGTPTDLSDDNGSTGLNDQNILIYRTAAGESEALTAQEVSVSFTSDQRTFVFTPSILGSATEPVQYTVFLKDTLQNVKGDKILSNGGYRWFFTVGTQVDTTPPTVTSVTPESGGQFDRNIIVELQFSEPVDPTSASGIQNPDIGSAFDHIRVEREGGERVAGEFIISNQYRTVSFVPTEVCGANTCGETLFCLPASDALVVTAAAATPGSNPPQVDVYPYDGIVDMAGNALDGNANGEAGDDYQYGFSTSADVHISAPRIESIIPGLESREDVPLDQPVIITFGSLMSAYTLNASTISLTSNPSHQLWYNPSRQNVTAEGQPLSAGDVPAKTQVTIRHGVFLESTEDAQYSYGVTVDSQVRDQYQNCFNPADGPAVGGGQCGTTPSAPYCCNGTPSSDACVLF